MYLLALYPRQVKNPFDVFRETLYMELIFHYQQQVRVFMRESGS